MAVHSRRDSTRVTENQFKFMLGRSNGCYILAKKFDGNISREGERSIHGVD